MRRHPKNLKSPEQQERLNRYLDENPVLKEIYRVKQRLMEILLLKAQNVRSCQRLIPRLLEEIRQLQDSGLHSLVTLGETLEAWQEEIACMWRFTKNNGITEGFHNKMETLSRKAYGFRNFESYRLRVRLMCS